MPITLVTANRVEIAANYTRVRYWDARSQSDHAIPIYPRSEPRRYNNACFLPILDWDGTSAKMDHVHKHAFLKLALKLYEDEISANHLKMLTREVGAAVDAGVNEPDTWLAICQNAKANGLQLVPDPDNPDYGVLGARADMVVECLGSGELDVSLIGALRPFLLGHPEQRPEDELPFAIATGSPRAAIKAAIAAMGRNGDNVRIEDNLMVCATETPKGKPQADPILAAADLLRSYRIKHGISNEPLETLNRILVIGDTMSDVGAAVRANARLCILGWHNSHFDLKEHFDRLVLDLRQEVGDKEVENRKTIVISMPGWDNLERVILPAAA